MPEHEPNWSCEWCGTRYYRHPCWFKNGVMACCSRRCAGFNKGRQTAPEVYGQRVVKGDGCWGWNGAVNSWGYGLIHLWDGTKRLAALAHRVSYEIHVGPIPDGLFVLHRCDNPPCSNPDHLFVGTNDDNVADMVSKGRQQQGSRHAHAKLDETKVAEIRRRAAGGEMKKGLAAEFGISPQTVSDILHGRLWNHVKA